MPVLDASGLDEDPDGVAFLRAVLHPAPGKFDELNCPNGILANGGRGLGSMFDRSKILDEGMGAALDGLAVETCPYQNGSVESDLWMQGWMCAADDEPDEHSSSWLKIRNPDFARP